MADLVQHTPPNKGVTEIRVHGVGGANPASMLGRTDVYQVTGDATAGLYRATSPVDKDRTVEAYSWGGLTARGRARALWVLLLPFALINLAGWMVEPVPSEDIPESQNWLQKLLTGVVVGVASRLEALQRFLVHITAMALTGAYVMWTALMAMNLLAYQCGATDECADDKIYARFLRGDFFIDHPGRRVVVGALIPLALLGLFAALSRVSQARYESFTVDTAEAGRRKGHKPTVLTTDMDKQSFWFTNEWHSRLFRVHVAWTLAFLGGITAYAAWQLGSNLRDADMPNWAQQSAFWVFVASIALAIALLFYMGSSVRAEKKLWSDRGDSLTLQSHWLLWSSIVVMAASLIVMWQAQGPDTSIWHPADPDALVMLRLEPDLWGFGWTPVLLFLFAVLGVLLFSFVEVAKWAVTCEITPGLFFIAIAGVMILAWPYAPAVVGLAAFIAVSTRVAEHRLCRDKLTPIKEYVGVGVATLLLLGLQILGNAQWPESIWGNEWPRLTPLLFSAAVLYFLFFRFAKKPESETGLPDASTSALLVPVAAAGVLVAVGFGLAQILGQPDAVYLSLYAVWIVMSFFRVAVQKHEGFRWNGPGAVSLFGVALTAGLFSGGLIRFASLLTGEVFEPTTVELYEWLAVGFAAVMTMALVAFVTWLIFSLFTHGATAAKAFDARREADTKDNLPKEVAHGIRAKVRNWVTIARGIEAVDVFIMHISMVVLFATVGLIIHLAVTSDSLTDLLDQEVGDSWEPLVGASAWLSLLLVIGTVLAVRSGLRDAGFRRQIGIIWDVTSFWPRHFHPFAPPSYAVRTVPEIQERLNEIEESKGAAILSGHSQGSVVAFAATASVDTKAVDRMALVTHGSPLRRFYARFFPSYFTRELLDRTATAVGPNHDPGDGYWLNFHRRTDPIAVPVFDEERGHGASASLNPAIAKAIKVTEELPDVPLEDPHSVEWLPRQPPPQVLWHLSYMADPRMSKAISELAGLLDPDDQTTSSIEE